MRKIFLILFFIFCNFSVVFSYQEPKIITREEWWANLDYIDKNSIEWQKKFSNTQTKPKTPAQITAEEKTKKINSILLTDFAEDNEISGTSYTYEWRELVWPIQYSKKIRAIVVHHTVSNYDDSYEWIRSIYKYHALKNGRGDIGYNFLIWKNWEIFEWRAGWEMAVWAHAVRNNRQTIWISIIWDYSSTPISQAQYESLEKLINYLVEKYNIDLNKKEAFNKNCTWKNCISLLETNYNYPIVWHRDTWNTTCPWDELYAQMKQIRNNILIKKWITPIDDFSSYDPKKQTFFELFDKIPEKKLLELMVKIEQILEKENNSQILELKKYILKYFEEKNIYKTSDRTDKDIKIKLSYPEDSDYITLFDGWLEKKIEKSTNWKLLIDWVEYDNYSMKSTINPYVEITSWSRIPTWDTEKKYNDNKFRWEIFVYLKDWKFVVVNILKIEDYLKWLWEISNSENMEKAEAIIISARTYALWYVEKDRKFPWEFYDWSDNPDAFQKYLWYSLENRSERLNKIVEATKWVVLTYNWELIKPWYFSSSSGFTLSFYDYCIWNKNSVNFCETEKLKYPFLQSKIDLWWIWKIRLWHWVWLSGTWATYFSAKWWNSAMILKYFYEWISVK